MTLRVTDELSRLLGETTWNNRYDIWLWLSLYIYEQADFDPDGCNGSSMRDRIARFLKNNPLSKERLALEKDRFLIPNAHLKWITGEERQHQWLVPRIEDITDERRISRLPRLLGKELLVAMIDIWDTDISEKVKALESLRRSWQRHKEMDYVFEWFDDKKEGPERRKLAWEWLRKNERRLIRSTPSFDNHNELLMFFDRADLREAERTLIIQGIRRSWNRQQHRDRMEGKKQYNFILSEKTVGLLDELAEIHSLKRAQILELLVKMESETGICLGDRLKTIQ